jgi:hypothetical protein
MTAWHCCDVGQKHRVQKKWSSNPLEWIWNGLMLVSYPRPGTKAIPNPILSMAVLMSLS